MGVLAAVRPCVCFVAANYQPSMSYSLYTSEDAPCTLPPSVSPSQQGACHSHCGLAIYIKKYLKAKEDLWKLKYFTMQKKNT